jgi:hypothetical protein
MGDGALSTLSPRVSAMVERRPANSLASISQAFSDQDLINLQLTKEVDVFNYKGALCTHKPSEKSGSHTCVVLEALHFR